MNVIRYGENFSFLMQVLAPSSRHTPCNGAQGSTLYTLKTSDRRGADVRSPDRSSIVEVGGSNEIQIFGRIVAFLVSYASEFQGVSFDTPYDILI